VNQVEKGRTMLLIDLFRKEKPKERLTITICFFLLKTSTEKEAKRGGSGISLVGLSHKARSTNFQTALSQSLVEFFF
jgi:hypothetical protein